MWESLKWLLERAIIPFAAAFGGAYFAYRFSKRIMEEQSKERIKAYLRLVKEDVKKGKKLLEMVLSARTTPRKMVLVYMPVTYFPSLNLVELGRYVTDSCVEHIRNIHENVFSAWNHTLDEIHKMTYEEIPDQQIYQFYQLKLINALVDERPGHNYIKACNTVMDAIDDELRKLK